MLQQANFINVLMVVAIQIHIENTPWILGMNLAQNPTKWFDITTVPGFAPLLW